MDQLLALRVFARIAETGAFSKAADALGVPRPSATKLIQELEDHLGVALLQRTTRKVTVTPEGAAYYERAGRLISEVDEMDASASHARAQPRGRLRIDIGASLANVVLIPALPDFRTRYPDIELMLGLSDRPVDLIGDGVDVVIRGGVVEDTLLIGRKIAELEYLTCASPGYLKEHGTPKRPADLEKDHCLFSYFSTLSGQVLDLRFERRGVPTKINAPTAIAVNEGTAHVTGLVKGLGVGQTFTVLAQRHIDSGELLPILDGWSRPKHPLHVLYPPTRHLHAKVRVFVDWVANVFEDAMHAR